MKKCLHLKKPKQPRRKQQAPPPTRKQLAMRSQPRRLSSPREAERDARLAVALQRSMAQFWN